MQTLSRGIEEQVNPEKREISRVSWSVLAIMRFYLAVMVVFYHVPFFCASTDIAVKISKFLPGYAAVLVFMLISGYSIAHSAATQPKGFYLRRIERVFPVYLASIVLACLGWAIYGPAPVSAVGLFEAPASVWTVVANFFMLQGTLTDHLQTNQVTWSLSIECLFYLFAPLFTRTSTRNLLILWAVSALLYLIPAAFHLPEPNSSKYGLGAIMLLWSWLIGFLIYRHQSESWVWILALVSGGFLISHYDLGVCVYSGYMYTLAVVVIMMVKTLPAWLNKISGYLGDLSYPLYLVHFPTMLLLACSGRTAPSWLLVLGAVIMTLLVYHVIDKPYRSKLKKARMVSELS